MHHAFSGLHVLHNMGLYAEKAIKNGRKLYCRTHTAILVLLKISKDWRLFYRTSSVDRLFNVLIIQERFNSVVFITSLNAAYILSFQNWKGYVENK